jgi:hypothetical protein
MVRLPGVLNNEQSLESTVLSIFDRDPKSVGTGLHDLTFLGAN